MATFLYHDRMHCEVVFVRRIEADNGDEALEKGMEGEGELLGVAVGDIVAGGESCGIFLDAPIFMPEGVFYPEPKEG